MIGIPASTEAVYRTCYHIDLSAKKAALGKYNYTEMMKKAAQQTDDNITYYEPDKYGRVFVDPAHPSRATFETADTSDVSLPASSSTYMPAVNTKAEEKEKARKKEEREEQDKQARLLQKGGQAWLEPAGTTRNTGNYLQPIGNRPAQGSAANKGKSFFPYQLSENHRVIVGPGCTIPMWSEDTIYYGMDGDNQDVHVTLTEDSTEDDPIVRIKGHSASGEFDFTRHIKDIDPSNASYAEMCALIGWEERINPSGKKGLLMPTPLGMDVGNVTRK